jgi:hypothetical protein
MEITKIHVKDTDDGALHFCILFLWTLSIVPVFQNKTQRFRDWLCLRPQVLKRKGKGEVILSGGSLRHS